MIRAVKRHSIIKRLLAVINADGPAETRFRANVGESENFSLKLRKFQQLREFAETRFNYILTLLFTVLAHIVTD